jgi:hypothetical protein
LYVPSGHGEHPVKLLRPAAVLYVPCGQFMHLTTEFMPNPVLYVFVGQYIQFDIPVPEYVPLLHKMHSDPPVVLR